MPSRAMIALCALLALAATVQSASVGVGIRLPFGKLMNEQEYAKQRDLLVLALTHLQEKPITDMDSWYQIGGIHGMPAVSYDGVKNETSPYEDQRWLGYCDHSGVIFPTWHRPYVMRLENAIRKAAMDIAEMFEYQFGLNVYKAAAEELRWPFWDWALDGLAPKEVYEPTILVRVPPRMKWERIANPFYSYTFQNDTSAGPQYDVSKTSPFYSPKGSTTFRYPYPNSTNDGGFSSNQTDQQLVYNDLGNITSGWVMDLFNIPDWECFSNRGSQITNPRCVLQSIESVHNWIHLYIGGFQPVGLGAYTGHMSLLQTAGFEPAFFLHHCNVDRLFALWQSFWPGEFVFPATSTSGTFMYDKGQPLNQSSPLYPFKFESGESAGEFYTSSDVANTWSLGYTYPDLAESPSTTNLYAKLVAMYGPVRTDAWRWFVNFNCTSDDPAVPTASGLVINATFVYNGVRTNTSDQPSPTLMSIGTMQTRSGVNNNGQAILVSEVTRALEGAGVPLSQIVAIGGNVANGPSTAPLPPSAFPANCYLADFTPVPCTCTKNLMWAWNAGATDPYAFLQGFFTTSGLDGWGGTYSTA